MRRVNILGVEISAVNKETAIQYLLENMDKARGKYICACNVHTTVTAHENLLSSGSKQFIYDFARRKALI